MSAETLRRAASLMRRRAERTTDGPWGYSSQWTTPSTMLTRITRGTSVIAERRGRDGDGQGCIDLDHLSYWTPAVALAVADWLDSVARAERHEINGADIANALTVARAYLGESA